MPSQPSPRVGASMRTMLMRGTLSGSDLAVARVAERVERECDEAGGDDAEQQGAVGAVHDLRERAVEADGSTRLVVDGGLDEEDPDEPEDDGPSQVAGRPEPGDP